MIMTVNPGFGGQSFIPYCRDKVADLYRMLEQKGLKTDIEVDGGINLENVEDIIEAGANIIVAGSAIFHGDIAKNVSDFLQVI